MATKDVSCMDERTEKTIKCISAIAGIALVAATGIIMGLDGLLYMSSIALLAGLGGHAILSQKELGQQLITFLDEFQKRQKN
jgi:hypothetical protein